MAKSNRGSGNGRNGRDGQLATRKVRSASARRATATTIADNAVEVDAPVGRMDATPTLLTDGQEHEFEALIREQLRLLGEDPDREGLQRTPTRVARSLAWLTRGYRQDAYSAVGEGVFAEAHDNMVMVRDIELYSLCEHHLLPFFGKAHIAYIPSGRILGLSKLPRLVEVFARRLQVQERLTGEIADAVNEVLKPRGVGVVIEAMHLCMMMRGVEKQNSKTITSALRGLFRSDPRTREEFLTLAYARQTG